MRRGWSRSAAKTPNWHVTELSTRTMVLANAMGTLSSCVFSCQTSGEVARRVKYMAKSPAKNITSEDNHTMVPTDTMSGRFGSVRTGTLGAWVAVVTRAIMS